MREDGRWRGALGQRFTPADVRLFNRAVLIYVRGDLRKNWTRNGLISWLRWNDRNGSYTDADQERDGEDPISHAKLVELVISQIKDGASTTHGLGTPQEARSLSSRR